MTTTPLCVFEKLSKAAFMNEVQKFPVLYDKFNKDFKDKWKKKNAWEEVGRFSNLSPNQAEEKYKSIRSSYGRCDYRKQLYTCVQGESSESTIHANNKKKRKKLDSDDLLDRTLVKTLEKINSNIENPTLEEQDEDYLFMKSLVPQLKRLNNYSKALAKVQIKTLLLKLEFPDRGETI
ncbi:uncharacterized protein LOC124818211 [Hydra vulgaris]|uniref:uncharacterized protein LOC124818211 n=1 Tax=Hydra vulgaris TaxID=6087 RepID=UPI001F5EC2B9|nr:uncharacterized protein LOC124818211 [Hydra vulgaris]